MYLLLFVLMSLMLLEAKHAISSPSDLSSDNSDLAMLKSLLAGLSLPSKSGILDRGSEEEKDGESEWEEEIIHLGNLRYVLEHRCFSGLYAVLLLHKTPQQNIPNKRVFRVERDTSRLTNLEPLSGMG